MGAYESALMEEGNREDLRRALQRAWSERDDALDKVARLEQQLRTRPEVHGHRQVPIAVINDEGEVAS